MKTKVLLLIAALAFGAPAISQKKKAKPAESRPEMVKTEDKVLLTPPVKVATVEGITEYRLQNGLRVLLFPDNSKQTITVNVTYLVGSKHENYGETGMAHLLEHLVFKGTP
ncbi:MAG: insulinase family protein, partial [Bacteroidota bacterium]|nr:insulinase family protein [Bacteroidota bacterium]